MNKRVLVTGGTGFIGRWAVAALAARGYEIHLCSRRDTNERTGRYELHQADLLAEDAARALLVDLRPTHLLHLAWETTPGVCYTSESNLSWAAATLNLVRAAVCAGCQRIVAAGSCAEYDWTHGGVFDETYITAKQDTLYGATKAATFHALRAFTAQRKVSFAWLRLFHQYGPHEHPDRLVSSVIRAVLAEKEICCSHGEQIRDFMCSLDAGDAVAAVLDATVNGPINVGTGRFVRVREVIMEAANRAGNSRLVRLNTRPPSPREPLILVPDVTRLRMDVGWTPRLTLKEGLEETVRFWREARDKEDSCDAQFAQRPAFSSLR